MALWLEALWRDVRGVSALEFAIILPTFIVLFFGGYATIYTVALSRKITIATHTLADLVSQYSTLSGTDMSAIIGATTQILVPYASSPLSIRISEITTDSLTGLTATVTWSKVSGTGLTAYKSGVTFTLPTSMPRSTSQSFIYAETVYPYTPPFGTTIVGVINLGDSIFMLPRTSSSVSYTGS